MILIGLGKAGNAIVSKFVGNKAYKVIQIDNVGDVQLLAGTEKIYFDPRSNPEDYESLTDLSTLQKYADEEKDNEVTLFLASSGKITGLTLRVLEIFKGRNLSVLLIRPESGTLSGIRKLQDRAVTGVLQEYARSGLLKELFLVHNEEVELLFGKLPVYSYFQKINLAIYQMFHMLQIMRHNQPVMQSPQDISEISRICTFGLCELTENLEKPFARLNKINHKECYFLVPKEQLETDVDLLDKIRSFTSDNQFEALDVGYKIFESSGDTLFGMTVHYSSQIQDV